MQHHDSSIEEQIDLIRKAMQATGVWTYETPAWVIQYHGNHIPDIWQWLQYIYLPMRLNGTIDHPEYLTPKINAYVIHNPALAPILQLTIELDAMTSTFQKSKNK